jgi:ribosomal protein S12 methylthiotransferase
MISLGCSKNLVDSEVMLGLLSQNGFEITSDERKADILIINTCAFIDDAREESMDAIIDSIKSGKKRNRKLIVTGCLAQRYSDLLEKKFNDKIHSILGTGDFIGILEACKSALEGKHFSRISETSSYIYDHLTPRLRATPSHFAYVKIAEGCDNCCSYCVIPQIRGQFRSRPIESILAEVNSLVESGVKEAIFIAQDTSYYGKDLTDGTDLTSLLKRLISSSDISWIRILYAHPEHVSDEFINLMAEEDRICSYIDLPVQHINDDILKRMGRMTTGTEIRKLIDKIRRAIPEVTLRTSLMVGFPGETDEQFDELMKFVKDVQFDHLGVFAYSPEEGTTAINMMSQIPELVKQERLDQLAGLHEQIADEKRRNLIGREMTVLVDQADEINSQGIGRTQGQAPDIDDVVYISDVNTKSGEFIKVEIVDTLNVYDLLSRQVYI